MKSTPYAHPSHRRGFSLVEVILAMGVISVAVLALVALLAQTMPATREVIDSSKVAISVSKLRAFIDQLDFEDVREQFMLPVNPEVADEDQSAHVISFTTLPDDLSASNVEQIERICAYPLLGGYVDLTNGEDDYEDFIDQNPEQLIGPVMVFLVQRSPMLVNYQDGVPGSPNIVDNELWDDFDPAYEGEARYKGPMSWMPILVHAYLFPPRTPRDQMEFNETTKVMTFTIVKNR